MFPVAKSICESSLTFYDLILVDMDLRCWLSILVWVARKNIIGNIA